MKDCQIEILDQETLNNKLMLEHQEPITFEAKEVNLLMRKGQRNTVNRERCLCCGRFKVYNTGGGLICTNLKCMNGISIEQDLKEVDDLRGNELKKFISS